MLHPLISRRGLNRIFALRVRSCSSSEAHFEGRNAASDTSPSNPPPGSPGTHGGTGSLNESDWRGQSDQPNHSQAPALPSKFGLPRSGDGRLQSEHLSSVYQTVSRATVVGRTGAAPHIQTYDSGTQSATLSVATKYVSNRDGFPVVATQWHSVRVYDSAPVFPLVAALPTGCQVYVDGDLRLSTVSRNHDVTKEYSVIIVSKSQGTVRVLHRPASHESSDDPLQRQQRPLQPSFT